MEEDLLIRSIDNAISRGDVDTLVYLWKNNEDARSYIDSLVPELADHLKLPSADTLKEFVVDIYDPDQARLAFETGEAVPYLQGGGISRARNIAPLIPAALQTMTPYDPEELGKILYYVMLSLNGEFNESIKQFLQLYVYPGFVRTVMAFLELVRKNKNQNWNVLLNLIDYSPRNNPFKVVLGGYRSHNPVGINDYSFIEAFVRRYYPSQGLDVVNSISEYLHWLDFQTDTVVVLFNAIVKQGNLTAEEKKFLVAKLRSRGFRVGRLEGLY